MTSRYEDEEEQSGYSALDHIRHFSEMRKLEESELSEGDGEEDNGSFGPASLTEAIKQPLFRKSKSQVRDTPTYASHTRLHHVQQRFLYCSLFRIRLKTMQYTPRPVVGSSC